MLRAEAGPQSGSMGLLLSFFLPLLAMPAGAVGWCWGAEWGVGWGMSHSSSDVLPVGLAAWLLPQPYLTQLGDFREFTQPLCASAKGGQ